MTAINPTSTAIPTSAQDSTASTSRDDFKSTTAKVASAAHTAVDIAAENLAHAEKALRDARVAAGEKVSETALNAKSYSEDALATVKTYIHLYPLRSVGIALTTGYLLCAMLKK